MSVNYNQKIRDSSDSNDPNENIDNIPNPNEINQENENDIENNSQMINTKTKENPQISSEEINISIKGNETQKEKRKEKNKKKKKKKVDNILNKKENKESYYKSQISSLEEKMKEIEKNHKNNMIKLSNEGKNIDSKLKSISKENNILTNNLESLSFELDKMIYKATNNPGKILKQKKLDEQKIKENNYQQVLNIKNKEIQNKQKLIDILKKDNLKLKNEMEKISKNSLEEDENKLMTNLIEKNKEIRLLENKIKDFKIKIEEHNKCERNVENINKLIENNKRELEMRQGKIINQERKNKELNTKLNMATKALEQFEQNKSLNKIRLKKNNAGINLPNINTESNKSQLIKNKSNQKYLKTQQNKEAIKSQNKNSKNNFSKNYTTDLNERKKNKSANKNKKELTEEDKINILSVFTEEEQNYIIKALNNNEQRLNALIEKLFVLEKYRNTKE